MFQIDSTTRHITIAVGSTSGPKIESVLSALRRLAPTAEVTVKTHASESGVSDQPLSFEETVQGAYNRALAAKGAFPEADFSFGIEGGFETVKTPFSDVVMECGVFVVLDRDSRVGLGTGPRFVVPPVILEGAAKGEEMGHVVKRIAGRSALGTIEVLTHGAATRITAYQEGCLLALANWTAPKELTYEL